MPYADPENRRAFKRRHRLANLERERAYQREWVARRRDEYLADKQCESCGSTDNLVIHHRDPAQKVEHRVWAWAEARRVAELAKCAVLCHACHWEWHRRDRRRAAEERNPCGTYAAYGRGCRCRLCKDACAAQRREDRARKRSAA